MFMKTVLSITGSMRSKIFVSSTCVTVHSLQGLIDVDAQSVVFVIAARSKNLEFGRNTCALVSRCGYDLLQQS